MAQGMSKPLFESLAQALGGEKIYLYGTPNCEPERFAGYENVSLYRLPVILREVVALVYPHLDDDAMQWIVDAIHQRTPTICFHPEDSRFSGVPLTFMGPPTLESSRNVIQALTSLRGILGMTEDEWIEYSNRYSWNTVAITRERAYEYALRAAMLQNRTRGW